ncbi:MAG: hypothetical protein ACM3X9_02240 [Bacillota bacterium]
MERRLFCLGLAAVLLLTMATMTMGIGVLGGTDLMYAPATDTLNPNNLGIAVNFREGSLSYFNFDFGLAQDLELGLAAFNYPHETKLSIRGKYRLLREHGESPGLAIGIQDIGLDEISPYIVLSKTFPEAGFKGYLGAGGGSFDGIFAGLDKTFYTERSSRNESRLNKVDLYLEADTHGLNVGTKLGIGSQTKINFGLVDMRDWILGVTFLLK